MQTIPLAEGGYILLLKNFVTPTQSATCFNTLLATLPKLVELNKRPVQEYLNPDPSR